MINKVILVGRVGRDPEVRSIDSNLKVATLRLATDESYKNNNGEKVTNTEWHTVVFWRGLANVVADYVKKGSLIYVEGRLKTREWTDKDGNKRYSTEIQADNMTMLDKRTDQPSSNTARVVTPPSPVNNYPAQEPVDPMQDDLPF